MVILVTVQKENCITKVRRNILRIILIERVAAIIYTKPNAWYLQTLSNPSACLASDSRYSQEHLPDPATLGWTHTRA